MKIASSIRMHAGRGFTTGENSAICVSGLAMRIAAPYNSTRASSVTGCTITAWLQRAARECRYRELVLPSSTVLNARKVMTSTTSFLILSPDTISLSNDTGGTSQYRRPAVWTERTTYEAPDSHSMPMHRQQSHVGPILTKLHGLHPAFDVRIQ